MPAIRRALLTGLLATALVATSTACDTPTTATPGSPTQHQAPVGIEHTGGDPDSDVEFETTCVGPNATEVRPDTAAARRAAAQSCARTDAALNSMKLPGDLHPVDLDEAPGGGR